MHNLYDNTYVLFEPVPHPFYLCFRNKHKRSPHDTYTAFCIFYHILKTAAEYFTTVTDLEAMIQMIIDLYINRNKIQKKIC